MNGRYIVLVVMALVLVLGGCGGPREWKVLIASTPAGAVVKIQGAEVGHTPVSMTFDTKATVTIEQRGYEPQEVVITSGTGPNLVVNLVRIEAPDAQSIGYATIYQVKKAYDDGDISKSQYDQYKAEIRALRAVELERAKRELREERLTKEEFRERVLEITEKYEG